MTDRPELPKGFDWRKITPEDSPKTPIDILADPQHRKLATPEVKAGGRAFDFERPLYDFSDGSERATGETLRLSDLAATKPVALIFGSYT